MDSKNSLRNTLLVIRSNIVIWSSAVVLFSSAIISLKLILSSNTDSVFAFLFTFREEVEVPSIVAWNNFIIIII
jgi:hypothetical protein